MAQTKVNEHRTRKNSMKPSAVTNIILLAVVSIFSARPCHAQKITAVDPAAAYADEDSYVAPFYEIKVFGEKLETTGTNAQKIYLNKREAAVTWATPPPRPKASENAATTTAQPSPTP